MLVKTAPKTAVGSVFSSSWEVAEMEFPMVCDARWSGHDVEGMHRQERGREGTEVGGVVGGRGRHTSRNI